jgi:iron complex transport system substrate-binding protein
MNRGGRRALLGVGLAGAGLQLLGCARGRRDTTAKTRVVSLSPSTTEAMFAIGEGRLLVGRSRHCDYPAAAAQLPSVGGFSDPNLEAVFALRPTLVIGARSPVGPSLERRLKAQGIPTYFPAIEDVSGIGSMLRTLGRLVAARTTAAEVATRIDRRVAGIRTWAGRRKPVTAVMVFDARPLYVAGPGGFPNELLQLAGGRNLIDHGGAYPTIEVERLLTLEPEVIIDAVNVGHGEASDLARMPGWSKLRAVREGRLRRLTTSAALRPGPRIADGLADVARAVHDESPPS